MIETVAVVGAGTMGWQIAALTALSGRQVNLFDADPAAGARALARMRTEFPTDGAASRLAIPLPEDVESVIQRVHLAPSLLSAVEAADLVIEAVREEVETKRAVLGEISRMTGAVVATNSSSLPSSLMAESVTDPGRLLNLHFFTPIWMRAMLEVMTCGHTRPAVMATGEAFGRSLGLVTAVVRGESKGFIINRVWRAVKRESLRVVDEGHASPEDVDRMWMMFFGTEVGPFGIMDMVGLDVVADIEASYAAVSTDPSEQPSPTLHRLIAQGMLGEKSGSGFYQHPDPAYQRAGWVRAGARDGEAEGPS